MGNAIGLDSVSNHGRGRERSAEGFDLFWGQPVGNVRSQNQPIKLIRFDKIVESI